VLREDLRKVRTGFVLVPPKVGLLNVPSRGLYQWRHASREVEVHRILVFPGAGMLVNAGRRSYTGHMHSWRRRIDNLIVHEADREFVLLDGETDRVHRFNSTASAIWRRLEQPGNAESIARTLVDEFDVEWDVALGDAQAALDQLEALSLIIPDPGGGSAGQH